MYQGASVFSGFQVPRGSGLNLVLNDGRVQFTFTGKERSFMKGKISARSVKWTETSRTFFKKNNRSTKVEQETLTITKKVRGFSALPTNFIKSEPSKTKTTTKSQRSEKVAKTANLRK